jgi:hypothetical protein
LRATWVMQLYATSPELWRVELNAFFREDLISMTAELIYDPKNRNGRCPPLLCGKTTPKSLFRRHSFQILMSQGRIPC